MKNKMIGIIAEDMGDVEVLKILAKKLTTKKFASCQFVGKGCGPLKKKIPGWCTAFLNKGVTAVLIVHDRDKNKEEDLRKKLEPMVPTNHFLHSAIVIPSEELEAWLLCDEAAIEATFNLTKKIKSINTPETIDSPKEHLGEIVRKNSKNQLGQYVHTIHNKNIAEKLRISTLKKCPSFNIFKEFISSAI